MGVALRTRRKLADVTVGTDGMPRLPEAAALDFGDAAEVGAYAALVVTLLGETGALGVSGVAADRRSAPYICAALGWLGEVEARVLEIPDPGLLTALENHDLLHRLLRRRPVPASFMEGVFGRVLAALGRGDSRVSEGQLVLALQAWLRGHRPVGAARLRDYVDSRLRRWYADAVGGALLPGADVTCGLSGPKAVEAQGVALAEALRRATALLVSDLSAIDADSEPVKRLLALRVADLCGDLTRLDADALVALRDLLRRCPGRFGADSDASRPGRFAADIDSKILRRLAWSPSLHPFLSDSYRRLSARTPLSASSPLTSSSAS